MTAEQEERLARVDTMDGLWRRRTAATDGEMRDRPWPRASTAGARLNSDGLDTLIAS